MKCTTASSGRQGKQRQISTAANEDEISYPKKSRYAIHPRDKGIRAVLLMRVGDSG